MGKKLINLDKAGRAIDPPTYFFPLPQSLPNMLRLLGDLELPNSKLVRENTDLLNSL